MPFSTEALNTYVPFLDLSRAFFGNALASYVLALGLFIALSALFKLVQWGIIRRLRALAKETATDIDDTLIRIVSSLKPSFYYFVSFFFAVRLLEFPSLFGEVINGILIAWIVYQVVIAFHILIDYAIEKRSAGEANAESAAALAFLGRIGKWVLWAVALLLVLSNLGVNITSLVAGLGIGGIAIAFALQKILGDLFSSFAIWFDKPFEIGDFIIVGEHVGNVERIGIKTTRLRALQGEEIVISNQELTSSRIQNFKKMRERRIVFTFGVLYETSNEKLGRIPGIVAELFEATENARLDRANFKSFGDFSLDFEVVYFVLSGDYNEYMNIQERLNLGLKERLEKEGVEFAYPTQTLYVSKQK